MSYKIVNFKPGSGKSILQFHKLEDDVWNRRVNPNNIDNITIINAIVYYVKDLQKSKKPYDQTIYKEIMKSQPLANTRVYDHMPGTGKATTQFYRFAKAISNNQIDYNKLTTIKLLTIIITYVFDQIE